MKVLIIEDEDALRNVLQEKMQSAGFETLEIQGQRICAEAKVEQAVTRAVSRTAHGWQGGSDTSGKEAVNVGIDGRASHFVPHY